MRKALRSLRSTKNIQNKKKLSDLCGKKKRTVLKTTKYDKPDIAYAPFHNKQNAYKSSPTVLRRF